MNFSKAVVKVMLSMKPCTQTKDKILEFKCRQRETSPLHNTLHWEKRKGKKQFVCNWNKGRMLSFLTLNPCHLICDPIARVNQGLSDHEDKDGCGDCFA